MTEQEYLQDRCLRHIWVAPRFQIIDQRVFRPDGLMIADAAITCRRCGKLKDEEIIHHITTIQGVAQSGQRA